MVFYVYLAITEIVLYHFSHISQNNVKTLCVFYIILGYSKVALCSPLCPCSSDCISSLYFLFCIFLNRIKI